MQSLPALLLLSLTFILTPSAVIAADFSVNPVRIFFLPGKTTDTISIKNLSDETLTLQLTVFSWDQGGDGEDVYAPTEEIISFPKILKAEKGQERIIRVGSRVPAGERERTYRIYLEEIYEPGAVPPETTELKTLLRVGVPVFIMPAKVETAAEIEGASLEAGELRFTLSNMGNHHFIIRGVFVEGVGAEGEAVFERELAGRYLHGGRKKAFAVALQENECVGIRSLRIDIKTDRLSLTRTLDVEAGMCAP